MSEELKVKRSRHRQSPEQIEKIIQKSKSADKQVRTRQTPRQIGRVVAKSEKSEHDKKPTRAQKALSALVGTAMGFGIPTATFTAGMMAWKSENPVEALDTVMDAYRYSLLGQNLCPDTPSEDERARLSESITRVVLNENVLSARTEAEKRGLTFADPIETLDRIAAASNAVEATQAVSEYTQKEYGFGVDIELPSGANPSDYKGNHIRNSLQYFTLYTAMIPAELIKGTNVSHLSFGEHTDFAGRFNGLDNSVKIDIDSIAQPSTFIHEVLGHAAHSTSCDGMNSRDPTYTQYNPAGFKYTGGAGDTESPTDITASDYGSTNVLEDVATLTTDYTTGAYDFTNQYYGDEPLTDKLTIILDRLDEIAPGSAQYLTDTRAYFSEFDYLAFDTYEVNPPSWNG